ncbi:MAG: hypothetical protein M1816_005129 [Peltula sp. TS41687]|nr:MAG: hypothetical protein M1816_005129 [Peltula sp. TS41687]
MTTTTTTTTLPVKTPQSSPLALPKITITYCTGCKWMLRAAYYAQELLSTFEKPIKDDGDDDDKDEHKAGEEGVVVVVVRSSSSAIAEVALRPCIEPAGVFRIEVSMLFSCDRPPLDDQVEEEEEEEEEEDAMTTTTGDSGVANLSGIDHQMRIKRIRVWDRKIDGGFPEVKELKRRVRDIVDPMRGLGHVDRCVEGKGKGEVKGEGEGEGEVNGKEEDGKADADVDTEGEEGQKKKEGKEEVKDGGAGECVECDAAAA